VVEHEGKTEQIDADGVFLLTGYRADTTLLRNAGVELDPQTCGPVFHPQTFETNVPGIYAAGAMIAGIQSGKIFIENGRFHGEQVIAAIAARKKG
jgi:thioredoxin reductase (NADPH)